MTAVLVYKQFRALVSFDPAAGLFRGRVLGFAGIPPFEGRRRAEVLAAFRAAVDAYAERLFPAGAAG